MVSTSSRAVETAERQTPMGLGDSQTVGGLAALTEAVIYVVGIVYFFFVLEYAAATAPLQQVELFVANQTSLYAMYLLIYVVFGVVLVALVLALYQRLGPDAPLLMQTATAFGLIWAGLVIASGMIATLGTTVVVDLYSTDPTQATTVWLALNPVIEGLGGGNEVVGGIWTLLVTVAALRTGALHRALNYVGVVVGTAGILSAVPALGEVGGGVFGLTQIVWFVGLGLFLLRSDRRETGADSR